MKRSETVIVDGVMEEAESPKSAICQTIRWYITRDTYAPMIHTMVHRPVMLTWDDGELELIEPLKYNHDGDKSVQTLLWEKVSELVVAVNEMREAKR